MGSSPYAKSVPTVTSVLLLPFPIPADAVAARSLMCRYSDAWFIP